MSPADDPFWKGVATLFGHDRWEDASLLPELRERIAQTHSGFLGLDYKGRVEQRPVWALPWVDGCAPDAAQVADWLGEWLVTQVQFDGLNRYEYGSITKPEYRRPLSTWPQVLIAYVREHVPASSVAQLPDSTELEGGPGAVYCLVDARCDQFMDTPTGLWCVDWEACVVAPLDFTLAMIELVFARAPSSVHARFKAHFQNVYSLTPCQRAWCRSALWAMNSTGDSDWQCVIDLPNWLDV
ncbi:hypothetical protein [Larsenimonas suaedae]|uniref:Aminoglycoside phosphotransferase domain-containing protein n=1 Tax=Larsenimonas suaedae TaxID=1851019 RepID=A0ABU1GVG0_9GAMM|nr:hypothetical protein [Larsenimonas suaedae]MCM2971280.1 hypothetical protein [Larsenimonas suaedae]MDR5895989.1 hypothetical protein [Larsenimonas suaedae]